MKTIGNLLWNILFLGFMTAASTWLLGALLTLTVVAAPIGLGLMQLGILLFWPFGNTMVSRSELIDGKEQNVLWKTYSIVRNVLSDKRFQVSIFVLMDGSLEYKLDAKMSHSIHCVSILVLMDGSLE